jgi:hypothetical protein
MNAKGARNTKVFVTPAFVFVSRRPWTLDGRKAAFSVVKNSFKPVRAGS